MVDFLIFDIPLLFYYINPNSSITFCLSFREIYLSFSISVSRSTVSEVLWGDFCVIVFSILVPIKSPAPSAVF